MTGDKIKKIKTYVEGTHGFLVEVDDEEEVTLVMCKDCKWNNGFTGCDKYLIPHGGNWFCADGERKNDGRY